MVDWQHQHHHQVRNKAHTLPYFLSLLEGLDYPKERIIVHIRSDMNEVGLYRILSRFWNANENFSFFKDSSLQILQSWVERMTEEKQYHDIITDFGEPVSIWRNLKLTLFLEIYNTQKNEI